MAKTTTPTYWNREDRDLLVELRTEMVGVRSDIKELRDNTSDRLARVEQEKMDRTEINRLQSEALENHTDHETRIRAVETKVTRILTWGAAGLILLGIVEFLVQLWFNFHL